jgi:hypothetical protein
MPCANCNHTADEHMQTAPMCCLYGSSTYKPIERLVFREWVCSRYPAHRWPRSFKTIFVDDGEMYVAESASDNADLVLFSHIGPVNESFYTRSPTVQR